MSEPTERTPPPIALDVAQPPRQSLLRTLGWAIYLAVSWTWCIGMFLPVLLVRDFGLAGFVVFAVPNVIGAAAMGWVLADRDRVLRFREKHLTAATAFGLVTIVFQTWFLLCFGADFQRVFTPVPSVSQTPAWARIAIIIVLSFVFSTIARRRFGPQWIALGAWAISAAGATWMLASGQLTLPATPIVGSTGGPDLIGLLLLAPVMFFGFALCPYLDLTFLRAASEQSPTGRRVSFTLGFCVFFLVMILFTLGYAWALLPMATVGATPAQAPQVVGIVSVHLIVQLLFTMWVHGRELGVVAERWRTGPLRLWSIGVFALTPLVLASVYNLVPTHSGLTGFEVIYRCFMSFYGLVFPAYVWLCMIPTPGGHSGIDGALGRRKLTVLAWACVLAAPCYWMGFIERVEWWLAPGLGIVLLSRLFVRSTSRPPTDTPAAQPATTG